MITTLLLYLPNGRCGFTYKVQSSTALDPRCRKFKPVIISVVSHPRVMSRAATVSPSGLSGDAQGFGSKATTPPNAKCLVGGLQTWTARWWVSFSAVAELPPLPKSSIVFRESSRLWFSLSFWRSALCIKQSGTAHLMWELRQETSSGAEGRVCMGRRSSFSFSMSERE